MTRHLHPIEALILAALALLWAVRELLVAWWPWPCCGALSALASLGGKRVPVMVVSFKFLIRQRIGRENAVALPYAPRTTGARS